ncbi:MAG: zinc metalloprotease HtpX [Candidatus Altiarchaeales archaeon ex4484_2]|nr:MAG: zinc metalloprotease HtpX [Candidatus Altiarchaeales archaeon ex4484_2]
MSMEKISFFDQINRNKRNSWILVAFIFLVIIVFSWVIAQVYDPGFTFIFLIFGIIFSLVYTVGTYQYSDQIALRSVKAHEASGDRYRHLRNQVEGLALGSGMPAPRVYIMPSPDINAFATGKDPEHSVICVTEGALDKLSDRELEAVLGHEMTHIRNYDIRFVTLIAVMVGIVSIISEIFLRSMWFGGRNRNKGGGNAVFLILGILLAVLAPLIVRVVQLAISRKREYMADAGAVQLARTNTGMISALEKIKANYEQGPKTKVNAAVAPMFLADPVKKRFSNIFNTHPPIDDRIEALRKM